MSLPGQFHMGGRTIGGRTLERLMYHGGHGPLYRAKSHAVKLLYSRTAGDPAELAKLLSLHHPRLVKAADMGESDGQTYVATEWLDGQFLDDELSFNPLAPQRMLSLIQAICEPLAALHSVGLVHGNLKASNVFVGHPESNSSLADFEVKILDPSLPGWTQSEKKTAADDVAACKQLLQQMMADGQGEPPAAMKAVLSAETASELGAACEACLNQLSPAERTTARVRKPPELSPPEPGPPFPTNWSPPPPRPDFSYQARPPAVRLTNPGPPPDLNLPDSTLQEPHERSLLLPIAITVAVLIIIIWVLLR